MLYGTGEHRYELVDNWAKLPAGYTLLDVGGVAIGPKDEVYVLNRGGHPVIVFDRDGNFVKSWGEGTFKRPHGDAFNNGFLYCADDMAHTVRKFTPDGQPVMTLGKPDQPSDTGYVQQKDLYKRLDSITHGGPPFNRPTDIAVSRSGEIYISDGYGNARVHKFSAEGKLIMSWGEPGHGPGQFYLPHGICVDARDRVWVADRENRRIQIFDSNGKFITEWDKLGRPTDIVIDDTETVYVSELEQQVSIFSIDGKLLSRWGNRGEKSEKTLFIAPHAMARDSRGDLYVGEVVWNDIGIDRGGRAVQKFARV